MHLAFSTLACPNWGLDEILRVARTSGYDGIELRFWRGSLDLVRAINDFPGGPPEFRRRCHRVGIAICCLDSSIELVSPEEAASEADSMMDLALALAAPCIRVFGGETPAGRSQGEALERAAEKLGRLGRRAAQRGLRLLLETHDAFATGKRVGDLLTLVGEAGTGALWDSHHPVRFNESPAQTAQMIGRRTYHVHMKDAKRDGKLTLLGQGDVPVKEILAELHRVGYAGFISVEWEKAWHPDLAEPEVALPHAARVLSQMLNELGIPRGG